MTILNRWVRLEQGQTEAEIRLRRTGALPHRCWWVGMRCSIGRSRELVDAAHRRAGPFATGGGIDEEALTQLVGASGGYPYLVQLLGYQAWAAAGGSRVTKRHATTAMGEAAAVAGTGVFGPRWGRLAPKEREFVAAMAQLGDGPVAVP